MLTVTIVATCGSGGRNEVYAGTGTISEVVGAFLPISNDSGFIAIAITSGSSSTAFIEL